MLTNISCGGFRPTATFFHERSLSKRVPLRNVSCQAGKRQMTSREKREKNDEVEKKELAVLRRKVAWYAWGEPTAFYLLQMPLALLIGGTTIPAL